MVVKTETECFITLENINKSCQQSNGQPITNPEPLSLESTTGEVVALLNPSDSVSYSPVGWRFSVGTVNQRKRSIKTQFLSGNRHPCR